MFCCLFLCVLQVFKCWTLVVRYCAYASRAVLCHLLLLIMCKTFACNIPNLICGVWKAFLSSAHRGVQGQPAGQQVGS